VTAGPRSAGLGWLARRHSLVAEIAAVLGLYALYEATRGLVAGDPAVAVRHARAVASLERSLHVFVESNVQHAAAAVPGAISLLGALYLTLHLSVSGACLLWFHRRRPDAFPLVRTALLLASGLALVGYLAYPTAPPRLAALGVSDTISGTGLDLNHGLVSSLYNPFAAVPSMHIGYAVIVAVSLFRYGGHPALRVLGVLYPALVVLVIVATGNHFFFDAAAGAAVAAVALPAAAALVEPRGPGSEIRRALLPVRTSSDTAIGAQAPSDRRQACPSVHSPAAQSPL
jgi:PAP2 superfamily